MSSSLLPLFGFWTRGQQAEASSAGQEAISAQKWSRLYALNGTLLLIVGIAGIVLSQHPPTVLFAHPGCIYVSSAMMALGLSFYVLARKYYTLMDSMEEEKWKWPKKDDYCHKAKNEQSEAYRKSEEITESARAKVQEILHAAKQKLLDAETAHVDAIEQQEKKAAATIKTVQDAISEKLKAAQEHKNQVVAEANKRLSEALKPHIVEEAISTADQDLQRAHQQAAELVQIAKQAQVNQLKSAEEKLTKAQKEADSLLEKAELEQQLNAVLDAQKQAEKEILCTRQMVERQIKDKQKQQDEDLKTSEGLVVEAQKDALKIRDQVREYEERVLIDVALCQSEDLFTSTQERVQTPLFLQKARQHDQEHGDITVFYKGGSTRVDSLMLESHRLSIQGSKGSEKEERKYPEKKEWELSNYSENVVTALIDFLYFGRIQNLNWNETIYLFHIADSYKLSALKKQCKEILRQLYQYQGYLSEVILRYGKMVLDVRNLEESITLSKELLEFFCHITYGEIGKFSREQEEELRGILGKLNIEISSLDILAYMMTRSLDLTAKVKIWEEQARANNSFAQFALSFFYTYPKGDMEQNLEKAFKFCHAATLNGNYEASTRMHFFFTKGFGRKEDLTSLEQEADQGIYEAMINLAKRNTKSHPLKAFHLYESSAKQGHPLGLYHYALYFIKGDLVSKDLLKAARLLLIARNREGYSEEIEKAFNGVLSEMAITKDELFELLGINVNELCFSEHSLKVHVQEVLQERDAHDSSSL